MTAALRLPNDAELAGPALGAELRAQVPDDASGRALVALTLRIAEAAVPLARRLALSTLPGDPAAIVGTNDSGDRQKSLDLAAHHHLIDALSGCSVRAVLSEEAEDVIPLADDGLFDVAIDPIDGSGSIGIGAPLGLLYAVFPRGSSLLRSGRDIIAAGYVSFGHSVDLGVSLGAGLNLATLDPASGDFRVKASGVRLPERSTMIAYNASNQRHWAPALQRYIDDLGRGSAGPRQQDFNMRWLAAAVGELHRILHRGGVFLYPADGRPGFDQGHLRLLYEAFPIAWLLEQAGGAATDGETPVLDRVATSLHQRTPLVFGSRREVEVIQAYLRGR